MGYKLQNRFGIFMEIASVAGLYGCVKFDAPSLSYAAFAILFASGIQMRNSALEQARLEVFAEGFKIKGKKEDNRVRREDLSDNVE